MSLILDALRRAEQERQLGQAPSVQVITQMPGETAAPPSRAGWAGLAILATALALLAAWRLWPAPPAAPAEAPPPAVTAAPAQAPMPPVPARAAEYRGAPRIVPADSALQDLDDLLPAPPAVPAAPQAPPALQPQDLARNELPPPAGPIDRSDVPPPRPAEVQPAALPATAPSGNAYAPLRDMPPNYRADFPPLSVDVHVYNEDPAKRWVMIDLRKYVEGQALAAGPRIVEILRDGIALQWRGQTVLYPLDR